MKSEIIINNLKENSIKCNFCSSLNTRHIRESANEVTKDCWIRCLDCKKDYGIKLNFYKLQDDKMKIKTDIVWKRVTKNDNIR